MLTKSEILAKLKELLPFLKSEFCVKEIGLFGSFADDTGSDKSDIDLIVEFSSPPGWKYLTLEIFLGEQLGRKVDLVTRDSLKTQIRDSILSKVNYI